MKSFPKKLQTKLDQRQEVNALRQLGSQNRLIDFASNDYLGFSKSEVIFKRTHQYLIDNSLFTNGATGSRLLSGNHSLYKEVENLLRKFHKSESALIFNSGYDANVGFFASIPQRGDTILYDEYIHASIRDGISISNSKAYKFRHNDLAHLDELLKRIQHDETIYVVTESVFSMDGDSPDLKYLSKICNEHDAYIVVDEAHALGVFGEHGSGLIQELGLENKVFARIVTFGKGLGCHGSAILGSTSLTEYLVNFARPFIYTTGLPPHSLATIKSAYQELTITNSIGVLRKNIEWFNSEVQQLELEHYFIESNSAIQSCILSGNQKVKSLATLLQNKSFDVKPILSPTVPERQERLRFCLHSYNSEKEVTQVLTLLATFVKEIN
ncbi:aminotransferase class I/II-fold pyridoxal phosphate-dependent enzyme [Pontimicrobium sp. SW4]|uniref:Aminotransferase class I/II-fold pyridoxal phosphate-dependent enzyme n=1 Tax=Pontimicrobium sp. SW4 TaxID=3153519 RepID=A0AAU7BSX2_9FLAO